MGGTGALGAAGAGSRPVFTSQKSIKLPAYEMHISIHTFFFFLRVFFKFCDRGYFLIPMLIRLP